MTGRALSIGIPAWWQGTETWLGSMVSLFPTSPSKPVTTRLIHCTLNFVLHTVSSNHYQDTADGEFARVKTRHAMHVARHPVGHVGVKDSQTFTDFGNQQMSVPGQKSKLKSRTFINLQPESVLSRKSEIGKVITLAGIKSKFHYVCQPDGKVRPSIYIIQFVILGNLASLSLLL